MNQHEALAHLDRLFAADGIAGLQNFAASKGIRWPTVYAWHRRKSIPEWRLGLFKRSPKRKANA